MSCPNCKCNKNKINEEEYNELKEHFQEIIVGFEVIDYMDENGKHKSLVEVEFDEYILEVEDIETKDLTLDKLIDTIIKKNLA